MTTRTPVMAGRFYEADPRKLAADAARLCRVPAELPALPDHLVGAIVPHAGWVCSGRVAGMGLAALAARSRPVTIVITGSVHTVQLDHPALDSADAWSTPLGDIAVDTVLREAIAGLDGFVVHDAAHRYEHSLEVELPLIQRAFPPEVRIVPVMIPAAPDAVSWGTALGELFRGWPQEVAMVCSTDLTHYGPNYDFTPAGEGEVGRKWAHEVNDRRMLGLIERMDGAAIVGEACGHGSACGGGAIAATITACRAMGAQRGIVLAHTDSTTELAALGRGDRENSVGYAAIVLG